MRILLVLAACVAFAAVPASAMADDNGPVILSASASPGSLPADGGTVTITAHAVDDYGIFMSYAQPIQPDNMFGPYVALGYAGDDTYTGSFDIPPNTTNDQQTWGFEVQITDTNGQFATQMLFVDVAGQPQFDEPPIVSAASVTPSTLPAGGGNVTIGMTASDLRGITYGYATVTKPDGTTALVDLEAVSFDRFEGTFAAPANTAATAASYTVRVTAADDLSQETSADAGSFTVAAAPVVVPTGKLALSSWSGVFGSVRVGSSVQRTVAVRNTGAKGSAPIVAAVTVSGAAFALASPAKLTLGPGQSANVVVAFRPSSTGLKTGALKIRRADGKQPALGLSLLGVALPRRR